MTQDDRGFLTRQRPLAERQAAEMIMKKGTIAVDFDGVLHAYSKGWHDGTIYDGPIAGAQKAMSHLRDLGYEVVIYSTRCHNRVVGSRIENNQIREMESWLWKHSIPYTRIHTEAGKPLCKLFIDDRAYRFTGDWGMAMLEIRTLKL